MQYHQQQQQQLPGPPSVAELGCHLRLQQCLDLVAATFSSRQHLLPPVGLAAAAPPPETAACKQTTASAVAAVAAAGAAAGHLPAAVAPGGTRCPCNRRQAGQALRWTAVHMMQPLLQRCTLAQQANNSQGRAVPRINWLPATLPTAVLRRCPCHQQHHQQQQGGC
jgi:hypothetical protein